MREKVVSLMAQADRLQGLEEEIEIMKEMLFHYMAVSIKLDFSQRGEGFHGQGGTINIFELYAKLKANDIHFGQWPLFITKELEDALRKEKISSPNPKRPTPTSGRRKK